MLASRSLPIQSLTAALCLCGLALACVSPTPRYVGQLTDRELRVHDLLSALQADAFARGLYRFVGGQTRGDPRSRNLYDPDELMRDLTVAISRAYEPEAVETLGRFFASELGAKVSRALDTPNRIRGRTGYALATGDTIDPAVQTERVATIRRLDQETGALETTERVYLATYDAILLSGSRPRRRGLEAGMHRGGADQSREALMQMARDQIDRSVEEHFLPLALYSFRDLSDAELGEFVALMVSPSGQWLVGEGRSALLAAVDERAAGLRRETISRH